MEEIQDVETECRNSLILCALRASEVKTRIYHGNGAETAKMGSIIFSLS
jgi:hypothetical protein